MKDIFTKLPHKLRGGVKCLRENGFRYTIKRGLVHLGLTEEPKKQKPQKQEPKKQEPKKQEAKKQEPKKQDPKKQEPKKQESQKQESKKQAPKKKKASVKKSYDSGYEYYEYYEQLPPEKYEEGLKFWYFRKTGEELDLENPKTYNEKLQWLKLYDSTPLKTRLADKYLARDWIKEKVGEEHLIPLLGVWDSFDEIDFDKLPDQFVLKANHGCGWNIIVKDKTQLDMEEAKKKFDFWMQKNWTFKGGLELHYLNIPPKIIAEKYLEEKDQDVSDYKFMCFGGEVKFIWVDTDRYTMHKRTLFTKKWEQIPATIKYPRADYDILCPTNLDKMIRFAELLSQPFAHVRVDFYEVFGHLYCGEMTFASGSGATKSRPEEFNRQMGDWIHLPPKSPFPERQRP